MSINPGKSFAASMERHFWRSFKADGGFIVSCASPSHAPSASASGLSAGGIVSGGLSALPGAGEIQLARIAEEPRLKLSLLRHKNTWASNDDNDDDDRNRDDDDDDKDDDDENELVIRGTPIPYNQVIVQDETLTLFKPGSFAKHLAAKPDVAVVAHLDLGAILGRTKSGTCAISEDSRGLQFSCLPPNTSFANDLLVSIHRKDVLGAVAAIAPQKQVWEMRGGERVRVITDARIVVASVVSFADSGDSIRVTQQSANDLDDDLAAAAHLPPFTNDDREFLHDAGIEASASSSRPGVMVRATKRSHRAAQYLEDARRQSLNSEGLRQYTPLGPKGR